MCVGCGKADCGPKADGGNADDRWEAAKPTPARRPTAATPTPPFENEFELDAWPKPAIVLGAWQPARPKPQSGCQQLPWARGRIQLSPLARGWAWLKPTIRTNELRMVLLGALARRGGYRGFVLVLDCTCVCVICVCCCIGLSVARLMLVVVLWELWGRPRQLWSGLVVAVLVAALL